jgi:hypothetical protein
MLFELLMIFIMLREEHEKAFIGSPYFSGLLGRSSVTSHAAML